MDFFSAQDASRRNTKWLVMLFVMAIACIIVALYGVFVLGDFFTLQSPEEQAAFIWWRPELLGLVAIGVSVVILFSSLFKISQLSSGGGAAVAESLGARLVSRDSTDARERMLLNVVDEMAIAAGVSVPQVYIMEHEQGINAFAAGSSVSEAVVAVTRGCLEQLNRDELQGVIAHEFSHIMNGDMRLNIRLIGILHGILVLALIGRAFLYSSGRSRSKNSGGAVAFGLALLIIGYIGVFFGRLIKAAVSRQREYLADASAVQYTRNPAGIAGALKKIGGFENSEIHHPDAESASHMFFGSGVSSWFNAMATHPPLEDRIARIDPAFKQQQQVRMDSVAQQGAPLADGVMGLAGTAATAAGSQALNTGQVSASVGNSDERHLAYARHLMEQIPASLKQALDQPESARALCFAMVLAPDEQPAAMLTQTLPQLASAEQQQILALAQVLKKAGRELWFPLIEMAVPALECFSRDEQEGFLVDLDNLIRADQRLTLFEFCLGAVLKHVLVQRSHLHSGRPVGDYRHNTAMLLSLLVHAGHQDAQQAEQAFAQAAACLQDYGSLSLLARRELSMNTLDLGLSQLSTMNFRFKKQLIEAATAAVSSDGEIKLAEIELLRVIGLILDCPIPPLWVGPVEG